jgi:hypothetical protein
LARDKAACHYLRLDDLQIAAIAAGSDGVIYHGAAGPPGDHRPAELPQYDR